MYVRIQRVPPGYVRAKYQSHIEIMVWYLGRDSLICGLYESSKLLTLLFSSRRIRPVEVLEVEKRPSCCPFHIHVRILSHPFTTLIQRTPKSNNNHVLSKRSRCAFACSGLDGTSIKATDSIWRCDMFRCRRLHFGMLGTMLLPGTARLQLLNSQWPPLCRGTAAIAPQRIDTSSESSGECTCFALVVALRHDCLRAFSYWKLLGQHFFLDPVSPCISSAARSPIKFNINFRSCVASNAAKPADKPAAKPAAWWARSLPFLKEQLLGNWEGKAATDSCTYTT